MKRYCDVVKISICIYIYVDWKVLICSVYILFPLPVCCLYTLQVCMLKTGIPVDVNNNVNDGGEKIDFTILL